MKELFEFFGSKEIPFLINRSRYIYRVPVNLSQYYYYPKSPEHKGRYANAIDIAVPNPEEEETIVYAPHSGVIIAGVLSNNIWGTTQEYTKDLNYLTVLAGREEFYEICHIGLLGNKILRVGQEVKKDEPIALAALNGRITITQGLPDSHIHMLVGRWLKNRTDFRSLGIRWENKPDFYPIPLKF